MRRIATLLLFVPFAACFFAVAQQEEGLEESSREHVREELGVNPLTAPEIQKLFVDLDRFRPIPIELLDQNNHEAVFSNRLQTAIHFGTLVADGFVAVISERQKEMEDIGRALIRQARSLGVGDSLTRRSKSIIELGDKGDWMGLRTELAKTQAEVETAMMDLHDEEMAHMVSFGGWLRGFQLAANATVKSYTTQRAEGLGRIDVMDYFIDRLETLHPRLKKTELIILITSKLKTIRAIAAETQDAPPSESNVKQMRDLADQIVKGIFSRVDEEGRILDKSS